eukprot:gene10431-8381_t
MTKEEMMEYRYQVNIDGFSNSWEAALWKYISGGVGFYALPVNKTTGEPYKPWDMWWTPAFVPYEHYIPVSSSNIFDKYEECRKQADGCAPLAAAARAQAERVVNLDTSTHYTGLQLKHLHDRQFNDAIAPQAQPEAASVDRTDTSRGSSGFPESSVAPAHTDGTQATT